MNTCHECGCRFRYSNHKQLRCLPCRLAVAKVMRSAMNAVARAVRKGELPNLAHHSVKCVDCGGVADRYEHRDYARKLDVEPVCRSCNRRRGPAVPVLRRLQQAAA